MIRAGIALILIISSMLAMFVQVTVAEAPANAAFEATWMRTDLPVLEGQVARTWMWGPEAFTGEMSEPYAESPGGQRIVQYFDKSRMEITDPNADPNSIWYVTNGLLVVELITGQLQTGNNSFEERSPAQVNVAGDADDPTGPTYATFGNLLDAAPLATGSVITQRVTRDSAVTDDPSLAGYNVTVATVDDVTNHSIAAPFWDFMNSSGTVYEGGQYIQTDLFENSYFATGRPISEPYWANVKVGGNYRDVLMQCFERRCLTYTPDNPVGFIVEAGNVGQHYHSWRYDGQPGPGDPGATAPCPDSGPGSYIYVADQMNDRIQKLTLNGEFICEWGGVGTDAEDITRPIGVEVGPQGNIYVLAEGLVVKFDRDGRVITRWGEAGDKSDNPARMRSPFGITIDSQRNVYVTSGINHRVDKFSADGELLLSWGQKGEAEGDFDYPYGMTVDSAGNIYVVDSHNYRVQKFTPDGQHLMTFQGQETFSPNARDVIVDTQGRVYVSDIAGRVHRFSANGEPLEAWEDPELEGFDIFSPVGLAIDGDGTVYVYDHKNELVHRFTTEGAYLGYWGGGGSDPGQFGSILGNDVAIGTFQ